MRHNIVMDGHAFRLRPVDVEDAGFILELRTDPDRNQYLHWVSNDLETQRQWLRDYFERPGDYYFLIENRETGQREGTAGIYNLDRIFAEWGRWIVRAGSLAALESACLIYRVGFEVLGLESIFTVGRLPKIRPRSSFTSRSVWSGQARCRITSNVTGVIWMRLKCG